MSPFRSPRRGAFPSAVLALGAALWLRAAAAQSVDVPVRLQTALLSRAVEYDRAFAARARERVLIFIVVRSGHSDSERLGEQLRLELGALPQIGGLAHAEEIVAYTSAKELAERIVKRAPAVAYLSAGLGDEMSEIAEALAGLSILSVGVSASYVQRRAVLGFDVASGRPQLVVHLDQARRQQVAFRPEFLKLARVIQ